MYEKEAFNYFEVADNLADETENAKLKGYVSASLGDAHDKFGESPAALKAYSKATDIQSRSNYSFILNSIEEMALVSNENWQKVQMEFEELINLNRKKYVHLNFYLNKWEKEIMEKGTPTIGINEVIYLLKGVQSN